MPFWSKQPVFHLYNIFFWLRPPGLISEDIPIINKYVDLLNIKTFSLPELLEDRETLLKTVCNFIKHNYISNLYKQEKTITSSYTPSKTNIIEYLNASNHAGYITVYQKPKLLFNKDSPETYIDDIISVISARPLYVRLNKQKRLFPVYYVDNLCVQPAYRKKNIASNMIQTHYYNLRQKNKIINTCLFKREGELNAIVPLVAFNTYCINIENMINYNILTRGVVSLPINISLIEIGSNQLSLLVDFIKSQMSKFSCAILPDITNIANLIKTENIKVFALIDKTIKSVLNTNQIIGCYVFRLGEIAYDNKKTSECISMISNNICNKSIFLKGFNMSCQLLKEKEKTELILVEDTADSHIVIDFFTKAKKDNNNNNNNNTNNNIIIFKSPTAFFMYNYACYSIKKSDFLIIY